MNDTFLQKNLFRSKSTKISKSGVEIIYKSPFSYKEYTIDYEQFTTKISVVKDTNSGVLFFVFGFGFATLVAFISFLVSTEKGFEATFFLFFLTLIFISIAFLTQKKVVIVHTNYNSNGLQLTFTRSNEKVVRDFAIAIIIETKNFLINKYAKIDKDLPRENQINNLIALRDKDVIDEDEFNRLKNLLFDNNKKIGF
jgi:hypothetical protein